jgi:VWFA-related protein
MRLRSAGLAGGIWLWAAWFGQQPPQSPQTPPVFRERIELKSIDVNVTDASGRPVHGLTAADFTLVEDGAPQTIEVVSEVNVPDAEGGPAWMRDVSPDVRSNTAEDGRLLIFLLDDTTLDAGLEKGTLGEAVKRITRTVIDRLGPTDLAAVLFTWQNKYDAQDFTTNHVLLRAAVDRFEPRPVGSMMGGAYAAMISSGVAESVVKYLIDVPARRKALIYVTPHLPTTSGSRLADGRWVVSSSSSAQIRAALDAALRAGVTVYGISPSGLKALGGKDEAALLGEETAPASEAATRRPTAPPGSMAAETGGFMISSLSQFETGITRILSETGSYYLLGYRSKDQNTESTHHSIEVHVTRPGVEVRAREGYMDPKSKKPPKPGADPLEAALAGVLPKADLPLRVTAAPFAVAGKSEADVAIVLAVSEPGSQRVLDHVSLQVRAFTFHGDARGRLDRNFDVIVPAGTGEEAQVEFLSQLRLKPGRYELRLSARSSALGRDGSAYVDLDVPNFPDAPVSLSGVVLSAMPGLTAVPTGALASMLPVVPTTARTFRRTDRASAFLRVYQHDKSPSPVTLRVQLLDSHDRTTLDRTETLEPARFGTTRAADYRLDLPLVSLAPGPYLLRLDATLGPASARRDVRFAVR